MKQDNKTDSVATELRTKYGENVELRTHEVRAESDDLTLEGYAAVYDQEADLGAFREVIARGAFSDVMEDDVRFLLNHDGAPMARTTNGTLELSSDENGLFYRAQLVDTQASRDLHAMIKRGDITQSSFAFTVEEQERSENGARVITKIGSLLDLSAVTFPAYPTTEVYARQMDHKATPTPPAVVSDEVRTFDSKKSNIMNQDLTIKDLQQLRQTYVDQREAVKDAATKEERDLNDTDVAEMERLADEVAKCDRNLKVKRADQKIVEGSILSGGASRSEEREMMKMNRNFSLVNALQAIHRGKPLTGVEAEFTEEANKEFRQAGVAYRGQLSIPSKALEMRAASAGDLMAGGSPGSEFVPTQIGSAIEALRAPTALERAGATVLNGLTGTLQMPRVTAKSAITAPDEGAPIAADSGFDLDQIQLTPRRASAYTTVTEQLLLQGGAAVEQLVVGDLRDSMISYIDTAAFDIVVAAIITAGNFDAAALSATVLQGLESALITGGCDLNNVKVLANGVGHSALVALSEVADITTILDRVSNTVMGYPYQTAGGLSDGAGAGGTVIAGDFAKGTVIGYFGGVDFVLNPYSLDLNHQLRVSIHRYWDSDVMATDALQMRRNVTA